MAAQSRAEAIVQATLDGEKYEGYPQSRLEKLLMELNEKIISGGGGGGTTDFNALENIPTISGKTIQGELENDILDLVEPLTETDETELLNIIKDDENN